MTKKKTEPSSAIRVNKGVEPPSPLNPGASERFRMKRAALPPAPVFAEEIRTGNRTMLGKAITIIESSLEKHRELANRIVELCLPFSGNSFRIGITGVPGAGKSTFIEALGQHICSTGNRLAVLAIDPSSIRSKGSILGDKTRMETLSNHKDAFIRPSPSGGTLGGVARKTKESIILCEAAGFNVIIVETVGVGQSETAVHSMTDFFLLLMIAGAGDELQGIKRGIMEMADCLVVNKADGDNLHKAMLAAKEYEHALHLLPPLIPDLPPKVATCSSINGDGISEVWQIIMDYQNMTKATGFFEQKRKQQELDIFLDTLQSALKQRFLQNSEVEKNMQLFRNKVIAGKLNPYSAAQQLLDIFFKKFL